MTATPWGFRDILPEEAQAREEIACTVKGGSVEKVGVRALAAPVSDIRNQLIS